MHAGNHVESNRNKGFSEIHWINTLCDGHAHEIFFYLYTFANIDWWLVDINGLDIFWLHGGGLADSLIGSRIEDQLSDLKIQDFASQIRGGCGTFCKATRKC